jgi:PleD family two-component response regulator
MITIDSYERTATRHGTDVAQRLLGEAGKLLKSNFRGSDVVVRFDEARFLVVMPDTSAEQSRPAMTRLRDRVDGWNLGSRAPFDITWSHKTQQYSSGDDPDRVIQQLAETEPQPVESAQAVAVIAASQK